MRHKMDLQDTLESIRPSSVKEVIQYREKYDGISKILEANPQVLTLAHADLSRWLSESYRGRKSEYTTEQILRALVVMFVENVSLRRTVIRIDTSEFLRSFVRLGMKVVMDFSFLSRAHSAISPATWAEINRVLADYARREEKIGGEKLRVDSTVVETNIHYPTDSSLLWDSYRTLSRVLKTLRWEMREVGLNPRFHPKKVKKLAHYISRNGKSSSRRTQRKVKAVYQILITRVLQVVGVAKTLVERWGEWELSDLVHYIPLVEKVISQAEQRILQGVTVPADEKLYSLFEAHTELLIRGKAGKPVEFGHKVLIAQSGEKFITHYQAFPKREEDQDLLEGTLEAHQELFGGPPSVLAADKGFYASPRQLEELRKEIRVVSIGKKGRRTEAEKQRESTEEFKAGQRFRAGSEGSISVLKRVFKLNRCLFKGFKNYAASVGCAVFCYNLVLLARL
jgi:transposase, IS5 family